jgi:hypothetical protein
LSYSLLYRTDIKEAIHVFRPVLQALKIRDQTNHPIVRFVMFDHLHHLNLDECSVQVIIADTDTPGMFVAKYTKSGLFRAFIVLSSKFYTFPGKPIKELRKIAGVHEFVHFLAAVYVATVTGTAELRAKLLDRLSRIVKRLPEPDLLVLYNALKSNIEPENAPPELTDKHFRLGDEGPTPDYDLLFLYLMFSRELFESYFNSDRQAEFRSLFKAGRGEEATAILIDSLNRATADKDVPVLMATNQLLQWIHVYTRPNSTAA